MFSKEIVPRVQNMITILGLIININKGGGDLCDHSMSKRIFTLIMNKILILCPKIYEESGYTFDLDLLTILHQLCGSYHKRSEIVGKVTI